MARHAIEIKRPIEDGFAVLTDVTKTGRWYPARVEGSYERGWQRGLANLKRMMEAGEL